MAGLSLPWGLGRAILRVSAWSMKRTECHLCRLLRCGPGGWS